MKVLLPLAWVFSFFVWVRNRLYDLGFLRPVILSGKVISVGNLAVGGTGKSPVVTAIVKDILAINGSPAIVTRGYRSGLGRHEWQVLLNGKVIAGESRLDVIADEAMMQSLALPSVPVIIGRKRADAVRNFLVSCSRFSISHWILDDGFQHRQIARTVDIVLLDGRNPAGFLLPAGRFREPLSALRRADLVLITKALSPEQVNRSRMLIRSVNARCDIGEVSFSPENPKILCGHSHSQPQKWCLVAGIAQPQDFERSAAERGITAHQKLFMADHCPFPEAELRELQRNCDAFLTTEKDFARAHALFLSLSIPTYVLPLKVQWSGAKPNF